MSTAIQDTHLGGLARAIDLGKGFQGVEVAVLCPDLCGGQRLWTHGYKSMPVAGINFLDLLANHIRISWRDEIETKVRRATLYQPLSPDMS